MHKQLKILITLRSTVSKNSKTRVKVKKNPFGYSQIHSTELLDTLNCYINKYTLAHTHARINKQILQWSLLTSEVAVCRGESNAFFLPTDTLP